MEFEWNAGKDAENKRKHGVSLEEAVVVWGGNHLEIENIARVRGGEKRNATMGWIDKRVFVVIWTMRNGNIRLISARRARPHEEKIFFENFQN